MEIKFLTINVSDLLFFTITMDTDTINCYIYIKEMNEFSEGVNGKGNLVIFEFHV